MLKPFYKDMGKKERPLQELLPYMVYVTDDMLLNKDGSLMVGFEYEGLDPDNVDDNLIDYATEQLQHAIGSNFDERVTLWWSTLRRKDDSYLESHFDNEVAKRLDDAYSQQFRRGRFYKVKHWLFVLFTGSTGVSGFMDRASQMINEEGMNPIAAFVKSMFGAVSVNSAFMRDAKQLAQNIRAFEQVLAGFVGTTPALKMHRLNMRRMDNALFQIVNPASPEQVVNRPMESMLDSYLPANELVAGEDVLRFTGNRGDRYAAVYGIKEWPSNSNPMMLEGLLSSDNEMLVTQIVRCMGREASAKIITETRNFHKMTQHSLMSTVMSKVTGKKPEPMAGKASLYQQCERSLARLNEGGPPSAFVNVSVMLFDRDQSDLEDRCKEVERILSQKTLLTIRERMNLLPSYAAMLPGQWAMQSRYHLLGVDNVADIAPIYTMNPGPSHHPYFSEVFGSKQPAHAMFVDSYGGKYSFVPHVGQVGHAILIAPTESGKTTLVTFLASQFTKYPKANIFIFDRDHSCRTVTGLMGGANLDYQAGKMKLNPFALDDGTPQGRAWIRNFIVRLLDLSGHDCTPKDKEEIDKGIVEMLDSKNRSKTLSTFAAGLSSHLEVALGEWLHGRPYDIFDNEVDEFELSQWTTIEMKELSKIPPLMDMFMEYAFRQIDIRLSADPKQVTFIYLEEASFLLQNPKFAAAIADWLKTFRKKNAFLWLTIQSPDSINGEIKSSLVDNIKTTILMYNQKVEMHREYYKVNFGLSDAQVNMIKHLRPKREYMFVQDKFTRVVQTAFTPESLNFLRSEAHLQAIFKQYADTRESNPNWLDEYLEAAGRVKNMEFENAEA
ncbi:VirB4 family type IV secretion system protein [Paraburkholderia sp. SIMBA_054]|uniref:VirB4 family type IV secretion system protein n=1 Tax=Paraburkholderia sp. SIMBA_054 TaxID=3085795 RepID=UPI00397A23C6